MQYTASDLRDLYEEALAQFPYQDLEPTGFTQGDIDDTPLNEIEYAEEFTFPAGKLLEEAILGGGWIELRVEDHDVTITRFFSAALNGDWKEGQLLKEYTAIQGEYNTNTKAWTLSIEPY